MPYSSTEPIIDNHRKGHSVSGSATLPLASFIGSSTEALADRLGGKIGGLLNATFGNTPDILVGVFGVQKGLIPLVKATLVGALISNSALIMGLCYLIAGLTYGRPTFRKDEAGHHSVLMMLVLAAILFPSVGALSGSHVASDTTQHISSAISVVLLLSYLAYVAYGIFGWERLRGGKAKLVILFTHIAHDGESNWLEGAQLLALYAMAAILFFALPVSSSAVGSAAGPRINSHGTAGNA
jgi:Ca2+/H+ antiporter